MAKGWVEGLRRKERKSSSSEFAMVFKMGRRRGLQAGERVKEAITYIFTPVDFFRDIEGLNFGACSTRLA